MKPVKRRIRERGLEVPAKHVANRDTGARRIVFTIEALTVGGAERMVVDLANEFANRGEQVHVVCLSKPGELAQELSPYVTLHVLGKAPGVDFRLALKLRRLIQSLKADVVNAHLWTANTWTRMALIGAGVPVVVTEHNRDVWKRRHHRSIDRILSRATARMIAVSSDTADFYCRTVGVRDGLVSVVNNGVDTARYASGNGAELRRVWVAPGECLVGTVGRLAEQKNQMRLVEAAALLRDWKVPVRVVIAGGGPLHGALEARIAELGLEERVMLLGERSDVPDLLSALDIFVLSSDREGHPLSALEAQAAGTAVVLTDAGGSSDAVARSDEACGGVIVERSALAIAVALRKFAENTEERENMGTFAKAHAIQHFDKQTMIERYSEIFDAPLAAA